MQSSTKSLLWVVYGEGKLDIAKPPAMFFYMNINIRRNFGDLSCILASEHPVNPIVLVAVTSSAFIIQIYK